MQYHYTTGRNYGTPQVLIIDAPQLPDDPIADVRVMFEDDARGIVGVVTLMACECDHNIGHAVLREYDAGRYEYLEI